MSRHNQTIALDVMGGDYGPSAVIPAAAMALKEYGSNLRFLLVGDEGQIKPLLEKYSALKDASEIIHTDKVVSSTEKPSAALRSGRDSSMRLAIEAVKNQDAESIVSAGNTGALMAMSKMVLKCLPGINRPAIASVFPSVAGKTVMLDLGANVRCDAEILVQFALLGAVYARAVQGITNPSVALLNVGSEEIKGPENVRAAAAILSSVEFPGNFCGFVEGDDIPLGTVDVVVTDGFTGNIALKIAEGVGSMAGHFLKEEFKSSPLAMLGGLLANGALKRTKKRTDPRFYNGGMFLGLGGICVKSHGSMDAYGFSRAILVAADLVEHGFNERVAHEIEQLMSQESFFSGETAHMTDG
jgi:phosphate acyltransferase